MQPLGVVQFPRILVQLSSCLAGLQKQTGGIYGIIDMTSGPFMVPTLAKSVANCGRSDIPEWTEAGIEQITV